MSYAGADANIEGDYGTADDSRPPLLNYLLKLIPLLSENFPQVIYHIYRRKNGYRRAMAGNVYSTSSTRTFHSDHSCEI